MSGKEDIFKEQIENEVLERNALTTTGAPALTPSRLMSASSVEKST